MSWEVQIKESAIEDLRWFGRKTGRLLLKASVQRLSVDPLEESRNMKTLRPNPVAQRELRLHGKFRILFNVDRESQTVTILLVGAKRGSALIVRGKEFVYHHESDSID